MAEMIHAVPGAGRSIAFTFDDGPHPVYTPALLDIFRRAGGRATFFMLGEPMIANPDTVRAVLADGHEIGNHSYAHPNLTEIDPAEARRDVERASELIERVSGRKPALLRPPYLAANDETDELARSLGMPLIGAANLGTRDWEQPGVEHILAYSRPFANEGAILLFHDGFGDRSQTIEAVRTLVQELSDDGFELVTVSELLARGASSQGDHASESPIL